MWQDWVIATGQWLFILALVPTLLSKDKPNKYSSLMTGTILLSFVVSFWSLSLLYSAASSFLVAVCWYILFLQKALVK